MVPKKEILPRNRWLKEQFKMDFKKCSEVYGYKSIAEVEEEEIAEKIAQHDESIAKTMFKAGKITQDDAISFFNIPEEVAHSWKRWLITIFCKAKEQFNLAFQAFQ